MIQRLAVKGEYDGNMDKCCDFPIGIISIYRNSMAHIFKKGDVVDDPAHQ